MSTAGETSGRRLNYRTDSGSYDRATGDWYVEPAWTVDLLVDAWPVPALAWDPACGGGTIPRRLAERGIEAVGSDIVARGFGRRADFLAAGTRLPYSTARSIICNPPYAQAEAFVRRALAMPTEVAAMLVQAKFAYSQGRYRLFREHPPACLLHLSSRPSMPPGDLLRAGKIKAAGGKMDFAWIIWDRRYTGPTLARWAIRDAAARTSQPPAAPPAP